MGACTSKTRVADQTYGEKGRPGKPPTVASEGSIHEISSRSALTQNIIKANDGKDIRDYYEIDHMPVLGSGISGQVKICTHKATKMKYALKTLSKRSVAKEKLNRMKDEIRCMAYLDHPNILRVHEYFENKDVIYLILELCQGGELLDRLHRQQGHHYSEKVACRYIHTMLTAIAYCHANNVVHRDLKLENFLFESDSPQSELKLIDFGLSQYFKPKEVMHNSVGTPYYVAPEVLEGNYDAKCDVWSIGVIAFMLLSGTPPFYGRSDADTLNCVKLGRWHFDEYLFKPVSADAKDFITKCLTRKAVLRPSAADALKHRWFNVLKPHKKAEDKETTVSLQIVQRLDNFIKRTKLAKIIMDVVAHTLLPEQISDLRVQFTKFDTTESGQISLADMRAILSQFPGFREEDLTSIFENLNIDQTGRISYHEFLAATISRQTIKEENLQIAFERMSDRSAYITAEDIKTLLGNTDYDVDKIMEEVGLQHDSTINFDQFKAIMNGGSGVVAMVDSPCRVEMRKAVFWKDGEPNPDASQLSGRGDLSGSSSKHTVNNHTPHSKHNTNALTSMHNMYHSSGSNTLLKNSAHNKDFTTLDTPTNHTTTTTNTNSNANTNTNTNNDMLKTSFKNQARRPSVELAVIPPFSNKVHTTNTSASVTVNNGVSGKHTSGVNKQNTTTTAANSAANSTSSTHHTTNKHPNNTTSDNTNTNTTNTNNTTTIYSHGSTTTINGSSVPVYNTNGVVYVKGGYNNNTSSSQGAGSLEELTLLD